MSSEASKLRRVQKSPDYDEHGSLQTAMSSEASNLRRVRKSPDCEKFGSLKTTKSTEVSKLRRVQKPSDCDEFRSLRTAKSCTEADKKVSYLLSGKRNSYVRITVTFPESESGIRNLDSGMRDHSLFVPKTAFPTAISKTGKM